MKNVFFKLVVFTSILFTQFAQVGASKLSGSVKADGSSTVFPITEAMAEEFQKANPEVRVTVGVSGTGGGFKKFSHGEIDVTGASRPIMPIEVEATKKNKIAYIELPIATDGLAILVNPKNDWVKEITIAELKKIWEPKSAVKMWSDIRASWPKQNINLYGPGTDSGTFDFFTEIVVGKAKSSRSDYTASEDDNVLVQGIAGDKNALGYFGFAYYIENKDRLKLVGISDGKSIVYPTAETIQNGTYKPLARPLFMYVNKESVKRPEVNEFVNFVITQAPVLVKQVGYVPLAQNKYDSVLKRYQSRDQKAVENIEMKDLL